MDIFWGRTRDRAYSLAQLEECIQQALKFEDDNPDALGLLGSMHQCRNEHEKTVDVMQRAVSLAPNHAENNALLSIALFYDGRFEESLEKVRRAIRLSPICPTWYLAQMGACYHLMNQQALAITTLRKGVELDPEAPLCRLWLASALVETSELHEAKSVGLEALRCEPTFSVSEWGDLSFKDPAIRRKVVKRLVAAGLPD